MKKLAATFFLISINFLLHACEVCERNQPAALRGIVHGSGPDSNFDYVIVGITAAIALATLFFSVKWLIKQEKRTPAILNIPF